MLWSERELSLFALMTLNGVARALKGIESPKFLYLDH